MIRQEIQQFKERCSSKELRKFAITIAVVFGLFGCFLYYKQSAYASLFFLISAVLIAFGIALPKVLKPVYIGWMSFAVMMGFFMTRVILVLLFCIVFAPTGLIMRLLGKDPMHQKIDKTCKSYWLPRDDRQFVPENLEKQF